MTGPIPFENLFNMLVEFHRLTYDEVQSFTRYLQQNYDISMMDAADLDRAFNAWCNEVGYEG